MNDYNGFTGSQRNKAQRWLNQQWEAGTLRRPCKCAACGQTVGIIDAHAEDYSEPFESGKTDQFHLCFTCHMMVHCRHRNEQAWKNYRHHVEHGAMFSPFRTRNWHAFKARFLDSELLPDPIRFTRPATVKVLEEIELGLHKPS